ncbi:GNAT family N-acetyltransferase [Crocinitomix sp.]|nr:GNAT family N-acetyltransferase [Crocinitomix sp.]
MIRIEKPTITDVPKLTALAKETFIQSHGHSAAAEDIKAYMDLHYTEAVFANELNEPNNIYHLVYYKDELVGFSKIVYNQAIKAIDQSNITKLERIYILDNFHGLGIAKTVFDFNVELAKGNKQRGIWLFTWTENKRAIAFYEKLGFVIIGEHSFKISETHYNPNWQYYLGF